MDAAPRYQVVVYTGDDRLFHPEGNWRDALKYATRVGPQADYVAIEEWVPTVNGCTGGWVTHEVVRDTTGRSPVYAALAA